MPETKTSFNIERYQLTAWSVVRLNLPTLEAAQKEVELMKQDSPCKVRIFKVTVECVLEE